MSSTISETLAALAERSNVRFGTSGVRGLVADLSPAVCRAYAQAFLSLLGESRGEVLIGMDLRPSSPRIAEACAAELRAHGFTPVNAGVLPTPALAFAALSSRVPAIMVTGSHIPFDRNGIKFYLPGGEITKADEARMLSHAITPTEDAPATLPPPDAGVAALYVQRYLEAFRPGALTGMKLGVYEHSSAARDLLHVILRGLGAETVSLGRSDSFVPIDTEAVRAEDRALAKGWSQAHGLDAILTTDGDADRPLLADEHGDWLRGDVLGILAAQALGAQTVVTPVSSTTALEKAGLPHIVRTRIGSPHVIAGMESARHAPIVGFEANGGFLLGSDVDLNGRNLAALPTRDSLLPMLLALGIARAANVPLSQLVAALPARFSFSDRLQNVDVPACRALLGSLAEDGATFAALVGPAPGALTALDLTDGVRGVFASGDILHLRLSGNAPELRCYTEAESPQRAEDLCHALLQRVHQRLGTGA